MAELVLQEETEIIRSNPMTLVVPTMKETLLKKTSIASGQVSKAPTKRP